MKYRPIINIVILLCCSPVLTAWAAGLPKASIASNSLTAAVSSSPPSTGLIKVASRIEQVTVYSDRALVTRHASVFLGAGESRLRFTRLPGTLDPDSVQVKGIGPGNINGVNVENEPAAGAEDEDMRALIRKQRQLEENMQGVQDTVTEAKKEREFIEAIGKRLTASSEKSEPGELNPQRWIDMVTFYRRRLTALDQEARQESTKQAGLQEALQKVQEQIDNLNRDGQTGKYNVEVVVDLAAPGEVELDLFYVVIGPKWYPHYDLRADSKDAKLQAVYQGVITQSTGEDWRRVELTLSTAQPRAGTQHPELQPWRIDAYHEPAPAPAPVMYKSKQSSRPSPAAMPSMARQTAVELAAEAPAMGVVQAAVENQASAVVFKAGGAQTIASNNQPHRITVVVLDFPAVFRYSAVPKLVANAFLQAKIVNNSKFPLLAGPTSVFLDNAFVANGNLKTIAPGEDFEAFLGVDEGIKVEHKLIKRQEQKEGVFGDKVKWLYEYRLKIASHKSRTFDLVVKDQVPTSGNGEIQVELLEPIVKNGDEKLVRDQQDQLEWHRKLEPGQNLEITVKFTVSYPKDMRVQGL